MSFSHQPSLRPRCKARAEGGLGSAICRASLIEPRREDRVELIEVHAADSYRLQAENMSRGVRGEAPPLLGRDDAAGQARAIEAPYRFAQHESLAALVARAPAPKHREGRAPAIAGHRLAENRERLAAFDRSFAR